MPSSPSSILIIRLSAIGDVVHGLATLDALHAAYPEARFGWMVEELSAPLLHHHPAIDKLYVIPRKKWRGSFLKHFFPEILPYFRAIRAEKWEVTIDLQGLTKSAVAAWACGAPTRLGYGPPRDRELSRFFYNRQTAIEKSDVQVAQEGLRLLRGIGLEIPNPPPLGTIHLLEEEKDAARARLRDAGWSGEKLLLINPGSAWASKRWPIRHFISATRLLHERTELRPLILWGPGEEHLRDELAAGLASLDPIISPGTKNVRELALLISQGALFLGNDTGPTHIASVLRIPVVSVFGASLCERNAPWTAKAGDKMAVAINRSELSCIQCLKRVCPLDGERRFQCLEGLEPQRVVEAAAPLLDHHFPRKGKG